jgi:type I restriction enzyme M protein
MALKKSDLYRSLWQSCDELRGGMDASQYKDYILTLLFVKYVTDKAKSDPHSPIDVPAGGSFDDMVLLKGHVEIGDKINKIIGKLAEANDLQKVIDLADFNDEEKLGKGKEMQDRLSKLVTIFADLDFRGSRAEGDDLLGDAYEYLMRHFATESGKSKGQFYTPAEVSRVMAKIIGIGPGTRQDQTVYDPTCGSGSLLLKVAAEAPRGITIYGQEKDNATWALSRMNMILHGNEDADIRKGDTITSPQLIKGANLRTFDFAVANPPFSAKSWSNGLEDEYGRFEFGMPPEKKGDYAFLLHTLKSLKSTGTAAIILPHGVLHRPHAEATIRRQLLERGYITGVIGLPVNLFYGTPIAACVLVLDKDHAQTRTGVFMIDAAQGFSRDGPKNRLRSQDIHKIVDVFNRQTEIERYSRLVPLTEIADAANDYNLNIPRYIDSSQSEDLQDLRAHLHGGIPGRDIDALHEYWDAFPSLRAELFANTRDGYSELAIDVSEVHRAILKAPGFQGVVADARQRAAEWYADHRSELEAITGDTPPSELIAGLGDDLLARYKATPLLDAYEAYEQLLGYWHETMHDDVFLIMHEGWVAAAKPRPTIEDKDRKLSETPDLVIGSGKAARKFKADLIPPALVVARYFAAERSAIDDLNAKADWAARALAEYIEEHAGEDGPLVDAMDDGGVTKSWVAARLKEAQRDGSDPGETEALAQVITLYNAESAATKAAKEAQAELDVATLEKYGTLTEAEVKTVVLDDKWFATVSEGIQSVLTSRTLQLVARIQQLGKRYGETLSDLEAELDDVNSRVANHLTAMNLEHGDPSKLLTGALRLPSFDDEWPEIRLGDHVAFVKTVALSRAQLDESSPLRYLHYGDIHTSASPTLDAAAADMPRAPQASAKNAGRLDVGDLVFVDASEDPDGVGKAVEITSVPPEGVVAGLHTIAARFNKAVLADGFKAYLQFNPAFRDALLRLAAGTKVLATTRSHIASIILRLPGIEEQQAIATALGDADAGIDSLIARLDKLRAIKRGMMQELLAGRTRLPVSEAVG